MNESQNKIAEQMARESKTIKRISEDLGADYWEVYNCVHSKGAFSWLGAKKRITNRLDRLGEENDQATREELVCEAKKYINYLYQEGKNLSRELDRAREALDG